MTHHATMAEIAQERHRGDAESGESSPVLDSLYPGQYVEPDEQALGEDYEFTMDICGACGGDLAELGALGWVVHYRCRNCGAQFSESITPKPLNRVPENGC